MEAKIQTFKGPGRAEVQKLNFRSLAAKTGQKCGSGTSRLTTNWQSRSAERISRHIIGSQARWKCGSRISDLWQSVQLEVWKQNFTSLAGPYPTDCHCQC